jgi:hypothetical protein
MSHIATVAPRFIVRVVAGDDVRVITVVAGGGIIVLTRDPYQATITRWNYGGVRRDGEKSVLLLVIAFKAMEKGEKDVVRCMGVDGGMMNGCKLGRRETTDGCMRVGTREKDGERGEKVWGIVETVYDIVLGGGDGCRAHVWWVVVTLWERESGWSCGLAR